jgi:hypothetical protein
MSNDSILKDSQNLKKLSQSKSVRFTAALPEFELFGNSD